MHKPVLFFLELLNIMPYPIREEAIYGACWTAGFLLGAIVVFIPTAFIILAIQKRKPLTANFNITIPLALTISSLTALLASIILLIIGLANFDWQYYYLFKPSFLSSLLPLSFFFLLSLSFFFWFRFKKKHKVIVENETDVTKEEV